MARVTIEAWKCEQCGHIWIPQAIEVPRQCPSRKCRSVKWNLSVVQSTTNGRNVVQGTTEASEDIVQGATEEMVRCTTAKDGELVQCASNKTVSIVEDRSFADSELWKSTHPRNRLRNEFDDLRELKVERDEYSQ